MLPFFRLVTLSVFLGSFVSQSFAEVPRNAHTDLYFPHLADGGAPNAQWQTRFTFVNPNSTSAAVTVRLLGDGGAALQIDFGAGPTSLISFTIPPFGTYVLQSLVASPVTTTGWAYAGASLPVLANVAFRFLQSGAARLEITAEPTLPSIEYRAVAGPRVGIAIANVYKTAALAVTVSVFGPSGESLGQGSLTIPPLGHTSLNLFQVIPGLPAEFTGSVVIAPQTQGQVLMAWAVYADATGVISSLPDGRAGFPVGQPDQIPDTFARVVSAYQTSLPDFGSAPQLVISAEQDSNAINAHAANGTTVQINLALAELISDSPSELAFAIAHEIGHIYQQRTGKLFWYQADVEWDADYWGLLMSLFAGYDPYAGAGVLGKLGMASGTANLGIQRWEDSQLASDAHGSFSTRIDNLTTFVQAICGFSVSAQESCTEYKKIVHPHFPSLPSVPLWNPGAAK